MHPSHRIVVALAAAATILVPSHAAVADGHRSPEDRAQLLTRSGHGAAVVQALGTDLAAAAAVNHMSATALSKVLEDDPTAWIGKDGQLFYKEAADTLDSVQGTVAGSAVAAYPASQTFALHSLPGSNHTIFLDFDGATVSGTWWNTKGGMSARFYTGFTLDSDPRTFTSSELTYIQQVWRMVSEKYAPFDVDVTTADPGAGAYNRNGSLDATYGDHVIITDDTGAVNSACGGSCSGVALVDTFDSTYDSTGYLEPAWVFSSKTWKSPVLTAHTVAHEVGHTFGLNHDGVNGGTEYYTGQGNWFPIMGTGTNGVGQFSKGEYANANNQEDDLAVIAANGAPLRNDDHGNTTATADALATGGIAEGVIGTRTDVDVFAVDHDCTTSLTARATGVGAGAALDMSVTVLDGSGQVLAKADPASGQTSSWPALPTGMDAQATVAAGIGTYYVRIDGVGHGSPSTSGYSDYGSLGEYALAISACDGTMPAVPTPTMPVTSTSTRTTAPAAPGIRKASSGRAGGRVTATARWAAPTSTGGSAITGYKVRAERVSSTGRVVGVVTSRVLATSTRSATLRLAKGRYRFRVVAYNRAGVSRWSAASQVVRAR